jgi:hypothetical protein
LTSDSRSSNAVAAGSEQVSASIGEISHSATEATRVAAAAVRNAAGAVGRRRLRVHRTALAEVAVQRSLAPNLPLAKPGQCCPLTSRRFSAEEIGGWMVGATSEHR